MTDPRDVKVGPASPVRDPSPPEGPWKVRDVDPTGGVQMYFIQRGDDQDEIVTNGARDFTDRAAAQIVCDALNRVAGVRGAGVVPPLTTAMLAAALGDVLETTAWEGKGASLASSLMAALQARGVVPSAPSPDDDRYIVERGDHNLRIVEWIRSVNRDAVNKHGDWTTAERLIGYAVEDLVRGVDSGGVAPAGPWVVERFYTQDKWFVRRGIEIPGEMSQFALHWFRSEAEAEAVCDVLNRVAAPRPAYPGNAVGGEALPKP